MPSFQPLFTQSRGEPVVYQGKILQLIDEFPLEHMDMLRLTFENFGSVWKQGVALRVKGRFIVNQQVMVNKMVLWQDTAPPSVDIQVITKEHQIKVNNIWDRGDGVTQAWHHGAAMIVDELPNGRRYSCNDGHPDENFMDIVFRIERILSR